MTVTALVELQRGVRLGNHTVASGARNELELAVQYLQDSRVRDVELIPNPPSTHTAPDLLVRYYERPAHVQTGRLSEVIDAKYVHFETADVARSIRRTVRDKHLQLAGRSGSFVFRVRRPLHEVSAQFDEAVASLSEGFLQAHRHIRRIEIIAEDGTRTALRRGTSRDFFVSE